MTEDPGASGTPMSERMQSLLSRAVEDQLSEQRQVAAVLAELRAQMARIAQDLESIRAAAPADAGVGHDALAGVYGAVREAVQALAGRLDGVARLVQERGSDLAELKAAVAEIQGAVRGQADTLAGVSGGLGALPAFGEQISGLQDNLVGLHQRLSAVDEVSRSTAELQQHVDSVGQDLRELRSAFTGIAARVAEVPGRADVGAAADRVIAQVDELGERLGGLEQALTHLQQRMAEPAAAGTDIEGGGTDELRDELARFAEQVLGDAERTQQRLAGLDERLEALLDALEAEPEALEAAEDDEVGEDPVLAELGELRASLLGPGGLAAKVDALAVEDVDARVADSVQEAVTAAEARLTAHIDEAVLALAEAMLRRRPSRMTGAMVPAMASTEPTEPADLAAAAPAEPEPAADVVPESDEEVEAEPGGLEAEPEEGAEPAHPAWQTPPERPETDEPAATGRGRRKRPWWRPGD